MKNSKQPTIIKEIAEKDYRIFWGMNEGSVFLDADWLKLVRKEDEKIHFFASFVSNTIENAFPVIIRKGKIISTISTPKLTPFLGWILKGDNQQLISFISKLNNSALYYPIPEPNIGTKNLITHQIDLKQSQEALHSSLRQDKKRNIKKACDQHLSCTFERNYSLLEELLKSTFERQNHEFNGYRQVKNIIEHYPNLFQVNVWHENVCLASLLIVYDNSTAYYLIGGFNNSQSNHNAGPFAMWNALLKAKQMELSTFDFEGSMIPSIAQYFKSFGGVEKEYSVLEKEKWYLKYIKKIMP